MNATVKNIIVVIVGLLVGGFINGGLISIGSSIIPAPEGVDMNSMEGLKQAMPLLQPMNLIFPFLAHALGVLVGAFIVAKFSETNKFNFAMLIGVLFLLAEITMVVLVGGPLWFIVLDLVGAYFSMAWLGYKLAVGKNSMA
ncbi:MAG: hypothetical protein ACJAT4_000784 [Granulosicoccus sp.]|jgi:hypothetical protein